MQEDVVCLALPEDANIADPAIYLILEEQAHQWVARQWPPGKRPIKVEFGVTDWMITGDATKVETFQPAHDCEECRAGNQMAIQFLTENPGRHIAMGNLRYVEVWPDAND